MWTLLQTEPGVSRDKEFMQLQLVYSVQGGKAVGCVCVCVCVCLCEIRSILFTAQLLLSPPPDNLIQVDLISFFLMH